MRYSRVSFAWVLLVFVLAMVFRIVVLDYPSLRDDRVYMDYADGYFEEFGTFTVKQAQKPLRLGLLLPLVASQSLFGYSLTAYYVVSIGHYLLLLIGIYLVASSIGSRITGIMSVLFASTWVSILATTTRLRPDIPNAAYFLMAFAVFVMVLKKDNPGFDRRLILVSFLAFLGYLCKMPNSVFLVSLPVAEWIQRRSILRSLCVALMMLGFVAVECVLYWVYWGDPFWRIRIVFFIVNDWAVYRMHPISLETYLTGPFKAVFRSASAWLLGLLALFAVARAIVVKSAYLIGLFVGGVVVLIAYGYSLHSVNPIILNIPFNTRYLLLFGCAVAVCGSIGLYWFVGLIRKRIGGMGIAVGALVGLFVFGWNVSFALKRYRSSLLITGKNSVFQKVRDVREIEESMAREVLLYPYEGMRMYFKKTGIDLSPLNPNSLASVPAGTHVLYSREFLTTRRRFDLSRKDLDEAERAKRIDQWDTIIIGSPFFETIIEKGDFVLGRIVRPDLKDESDPTQWTLQFDGKGWNPGGRDPGLELRDGRITIKPDSQRYVEKYPRIRLSRLFPKGVSPQVFRVRMDYEQISGHASMRLDVKQWKDKEGRLRFDKHPLPAEALSAYRSEWIPVEDGTDSLSIDLLVSPTASGGEIWVKRVEVDFR